MAKSKFGRLTDLRLNAQLTSMELDKYRKECEELGILADINEHFSIAQRSIDYISRKMAEHALKERQSG